jgi:hypothetical protein
MTPVRIVAALLIGLVLIAAGVVIAPATWHSMQLRLAADDPAALANLRLKGGVLTPERVKAEIAAAVAANDGDLARSFIALAEANGVAISAEQHAQLAKLEADTPERTARDFAGGFIAGETDSFAGLITGQIDEGPLDNSLKRILATQEGFDLIVAFGSTLIIVEAKASTARTADQLTSKLTRLGPLLELAERAEPRIGCSL